jgi:SAM-dependent methyltransferase
VALATVAASLFWPVSPRATLHLFYGAVVLSAWWSGMAPGLLAAALSVAAEDYFFLPPYHAISVELANAASFALFATVAIIISSLTAARRRVAQALRESHEAIEVWRDTRCPLCGAKLSHATASIPGRVKCECGMVYRPSPQPMLTDGQFWDVHDYSDRSWMERNYGPGRRSSHRSLVSQIAKLRPPLGRWLDIGCGPGYLLRAAADAGWQITGLDLSPRAVAICKEAGLNVVCGSFPDDAPPGSFEVMSIVHTLEYFEDPKAMLSACRARLIPGGMLVLQLKNFTFWQYAERYFRAHTGIWCPQDSRSYSPQTITALLHAVGFETVRVSVAELRDRPLTTAAFTVLAAVCRAVVSPSMTVVARAASADRAQARVGPWATFPRVRRALHTMRNAQRQPAALREMRPARGR